MQIEGSVGRAMTVELNMGTIIRIMKSDEYLWCQLRDYRRRTLGLGESISIVGQSLKVT